MRQQPSLCPVSASARVQSVVPHPTHSHADVRTSAHQGYAGHLRRSGLPTTAGAPLTRALKLRYEPIWLDDDPPKRFSEHWFATEPMTDR